MDIIIKVRLVKIPVEFDEKFDLSLDSEGYGRIEKISFEAYNESTCLTEALERFRERTGYYPERVPADQIYRTRENRNCLRFKGEYFLHFYICSKSGTDIKVKTCKYLCNQQTLITLYEESVNAGKKFLR